MQESSYLSMKEMNFEEETKEKKETKEAKEDKIKVLIVENEPIAKISFRYTFDKYKNIELLIEEADIDLILDTIKTKSPDIVICNSDFRAKENISGFDIIQSIKQNYPDTRIIIFTSRDEKYDVIKSLSLGVNGYCLKCIKPETLNHAIINVSKGGYWIDPKVSRYVSEFFLNFLNIQSSELLREKQHIHTSSKRGKKLTQRENEVLGLIVQGKSNIEIAQELIVSPNTAKAHVGAILNKLGVKDRVQAAVKAVIYGYCISY